MIYESDPQAAPDSEFVPGELALLVAGNRGRLLDARRTPVTVTAVRPATGDFEIEIGAFEDAGARWVLPLQDVGRFQFARDAARDGAAELEQAAARCDRMLEIACDEDARAATMRRLRDERAATAAWLRERLPVVDVDACVERREGEPSLYALLDARLGELAALDRAFAAAFVSNPGSASWSRATRSSWPSLGCARTGARSSATPPRSRTCRRSVARTTSLRGSRSSRRCGRRSGARPSPCTGPPPSGRAGRRRWCRARSRPPSPLRTSPRPRLRCTGGRMSSSIACS